MTFAQLTDRQKLIIKAVGDLSAAGDERVTGQDVVDALTPLDWSYVRRKGEYYNIYKDCFRLSFVGFIPELDLPRRVLIHSYDPDLGNSPSRGLFRNIVFTLGPGDGADFYNELNP